MLNKLDLELFEILDSEIDKRLNNGCYLEIYGIENNITYVVDDGLYDVNDEEDIYIPTYDKGMVIESKYIKNGHKQDEGVIKKILGHYPTTNNVLMYCINKASLGFHNNNGVNTCIYFDIRQEPYLYRLDITKEIKDYTDTQKQELINFLKNI